MLGFNTDAAVLHRKYPLPVTNRPIQGDFAAVDRIAYSIADEITKSATQLVHASQQLRISIKIEADTVTPGTQRLRFMIELAQHFRNVDVCLACQVFRIFQP